MLEASPPAAVGFAALVIACAVAVFRHRDRLLMLLVTAIAGLVVSLAFLMFSAPDLALTQIAVEVVATILLLLALNLLPKSSPRETGLGLRIGHGAAAVACGAAAGAMALSVLTRGYQTISDYHLAEAKPGGGGTNVVNVILVDFRGYDTFGEIIVLGIAALVIFALLDLGAKARTAAGAMARPLAARGGDAHPIMLVVVTRVLLPLALTAGIFIFLRGHNMPGGGFIAGIVVGIAFIMQYVASGYAWAHERRRIDAQLLIAAGILIAGATGVASWLFGHPFLTSTFAYLHIPLVGEVEIASAMAFDAGVFLVVVGTVLLSLATIASVESVGDEIEASDETPRPVAKRSPGRRVPAAGARAREGGGVMEMLVAAGIGLMTAAGVYLMLRRRSLPVVVGLTFLSYGVNLFLFAMGRLALNQPPILSKAAAGYADPLPQALVLTAIVISFGMTALIVVLALRSFLDTGSDDVAIGPSDLVRDFGPYGKGGE